MLFFLKAWQRELTGILITYLKWNPVPTFSSNLG